MFKPSSSPFLLEVCVGVTSRVPKTKYHYLLFDIDDRDLIENMRGWLRERNLVPFIEYTTRHGAHFIVLRKFTFALARHILYLCPFNDKNHVDLGVKRGYWFLANSEPLYIWEPMEYMKVIRNWVEDT